MKAHQKIIRETRARMNADADIFGDWWKDVAVDIGAAEIREIDRATAASVIDAYEWLGCMPAVVWHSFGLYFDGHLAGAVCYGPEYSENLGRLARAGRQCADWSRYGFEGKMILLSRGACAHWAHPHSASKLIRASMRLLPARFEVVTATTDESAGEIGTIYQACGFHYVGSMRDANPRVNSRRLDRDAWLIRGKLWSSRSIRAACGTTKRADVIRVFPSAVKVKQHSKHRYFAFRGSRVARKRHLAAIEHLVRPYPKRAAEASRDDAPVIQQEGEGRSLAAAP